MLSSLVMFWTNRKTFPRLFRHTPLCWRMMVSSLSLNPQRTSCWPGLCSTPTIWRPLRSPTRERARCSATTRNGSRFSMRQVSTSYPRWRMDSSILPSSWGRTLEFQKNPQSRPLPSRASLTTGWKRSSLPWWHRRSKGFGWRLMTPALESLVSSVAWGESQMVKRSGMAYVA